MGLGTIASDVTNKAITSINFSCSSAAMKPERLLSSLFPNTVRQRVATVSD
jgi:hypothetical protein